MSELVRFHAFGPPAEGGGDEIGLRLDPPDQDPRWVDAELLADGSVRVGSMRITNPVEGTDPGQYRRVPGLDSVQQSIRDTVIALKDDPDPLVRIAVRILAAVVAPKSQLALNPSDLVDALANHPDPTVKAVAALALSIVELQQRKR